MKLILKILLVPTLAAYGVIFLIFYAVSVVIQLMGGFIKGLLVLELVFLILANQTTHEMSICIMTMIGTSVLCFGAALCIEGMKGIFSYMVNFIRS